MPRPSDSYGFALPAPQAESDPVLSPQSPGVAEGEDDGLILWMLSLTPQQRLESAQGFADSVLALRNGRRT
ncbi:MAG: hypothetical protein ABJC13_09895 [Acidobacteriota bacterium]